MLSYLPNDRGDHQSKYSKWLVACFSFLVDISEPGLHLWQNEVAEYLAGVMACTASDCR